jgi:hypothetical protein
MARTKETALIYEHHPPVSVQQPRRLYTERDIERLHKALQPFVDVGELRQLIADSGQVMEAMKTDDPPPVLRALMWAVTEVLRPIQREQISSPRDAIGFFMALLRNAEQD